MQSQLHVKSNSSYTPLRIDFIAIRTIAKPMKGGVS